MPEAMMRAMILSLRADIVRADPHPLPPRGARVEKHEKNREKDDPRRGSQRIIDDRVQGDQADGKPGWNGIGAAARRIAHQPDSPHNQRSGEQGENQYPRDSSFDQPPQIFVVRAVDIRSEEHTSELQSPMRISYAVFCLKTKTNSLNTGNRDGTLNCTGETAPTVNAVCSTLEPNYTAIR